MIENSEKSRLNSYLHGWLNNKIETELKSLIDLKNVKDNNSELRALAYHLYENNGVVKRDEVLNYLKKHNLPLVVKADGLASGKGVYICDNFEQSKIAVDEIFNGKFGEAKNLLIFQQLLKDP